MIDTYYLQRQSDDGNQTFGQLLDKDQSTELCYTIELPWKDNLPDVSCIPPGRYLFYNYLSPSKGKVWRTDSLAPARVAIEIHAANWARQLLGCIAVGKTVDVINGTPGVTSSQNTLKMLQSILPEQFYLEITGVNNV